MHHRLIADLGLEILGLEILGLEILGLKILNEIFALIRIAHLDSVLSTVKKIISQLVLCLGRAWLARQSVLDQAHQGSHRSGFAILALMVRLLTKTEANSCHILSSDLPNRRVNKSCARPFWFLKYDHQISLARCRGVTVSELRLKSRKLNSIYPQESLQTC